MRSSTGAPAAPTTALSAAPRPASPSVLGARRLRHSSSIMAAASARIVTKKKASFFTTGPISAISRVLAGRIWLSESSCRSGNGKLHHHHHQDGRGHLEELLQIDADRARARS